MAAANDRQGCLLQNLQDAMCPEKMSRECMSLAEDGKEGEMLRLLEGHRKVLLNTIHGYQKALDSLDYLLFQTKKREEGKNYEEENSIVINCGFNDDGTL